MKAGMTMRLDRYLAECGYGTRGEVKRIIGKGQVEKGGRIATDPGAHVLPGEPVSVMGREAVRKGPVYLAMNKPPGYVSATEDRGHPTVVSLLDQGEYGHCGLFPAGRLDLDVTGLLLLTNDGPFAHRLTSPRKAVPKTYVADLSERLGQAGAEALTRGLTLGDGHQTAPAMVWEMGGRRVALRLTEGKYHQVKRMFAAVGNNVERLVRVGVGGLWLNLGGLRAEFGPTGEAPWGLGGAALDLGDMAIGTYKDIGTAGMEAALDG